MASPLISPDTSTKLGKTIGWAFTKSNQQQQQQEMASLLAPSPSPSLSISLASDHHDNLIHSSEETKLPTKAQIVRDPDEFFPSSNRNLMYTLVKEYTPEAILAAFGNQRKDVSKIRDNIRPRDIKRAIVADNKPMFEFLVKYFAPPWDIVEELVGNLDIKDDYLGDLINLYATRGDQLICNACHIRLIECSHYSGWVYTLSKDRTDIRSDRWASSIAQLQWFHLYPILRETRPVEYERRVFFLSQAYSFDPKPIPPSLSTCNPNSVPSSSASSTLSSISSE